MMATTPTHWSNTPFRPFGRNVMPWDAASFTGWWRNRSGYVLRLPCVGQSVRVIEILWELVVWDKLRPRGGRPEHLLWALYFMKVYPKQGPGCSVVGTSAGADDPETHRKWVWAYVEAITELVDVVVSLLYFFAFVY